MSKDVNKKGFSELSSLASDVELTLEELLSRQKGPEHPTVDYASQESQSRPQDHELEPDHTHLLNTEQEIVVSGDFREPDSGFPGAIWYLTFLVAVVLLWSFFINDAERVSPDSATSVSEQLPVSSPSPSPEPEMQLNDLRFSEPPVGGNHVLSAEQIRWCLRQDIWIEVIRPMATTSSQIDQLNSMIDNYNNRCASFRYYGRTLIQAQQQVESFRAQIVSIVPIPWDTNTSPAISGSIRTDAPELLPQPSQNPQLTLEIQRVLSLLDYDTGPVDGVFGDRTRIAIQDFQRDFGIAIDGRETVSLLEQLQEEAAITTRDIENSVPVTTLREMPGNDYFTRGSHENDLVHIQGTPNRIVRYDALGYETLYFGRSTVEIDSQSRQVREWDNYGNLNVQLSPGDQITTTRTFTRDSHSDDVLRLQGTPRRITGYDALGYEIWYFGRSTVEIDSQTHRVLQWDNRGNLKVGQ